MIRLGVDPVRHLQLLQDQTEDLRNAREAARKLAFRSDPSRGSERLQAPFSCLSAFDWSYRGTLEMSGVRRVAQEVHVLLSRLHGVGSESSCGDDRSWTPNTSISSVGLTTSDIVATLMKMPMTELASALRRRCARWGADRIRDYRTVGGICRSHSLRQLHGNEPVDWRSHRLPKSIPLT